MFGGSLDKQTYQSIYSRWEQIFRQTFRGAKRLPEKDFLRNKNNVKGTASYSPFGAKLI
jgi:hypothetical protein